MQDFKSTVLLFIVCTFSLQCISQDTLYAKKIDSLWLCSYNTELLARKKERIETAKVEYSYYKNSKTIRSVTVLNKAAHEKLLFFFLQNKPVMVSPSGQQPYFVLNDQVIYGKEMKHTPAQLKALIAKAYMLLEQGYKKIKGGSG